MKPYAADAQLRSIQTYLNARGLKGQADFVEGALIRIYWDVDVALAVTIVLDVTSAIPTARLERLVRQYLFRSIYPRTDFILLNRSGDAAAFQASRMLQSDARIQILNFDPSVTTGYARNRAVEQAHGDVLVFLSADLSSETDEVIRELVGWAQYPGLGAVTGLLLQPDGIVAQAGYTLNLGGIVGAVGQTFHKYSETLYGLFIWYRNLSAVSGDCLAIRREHLNRVGGFNEAFEQAGSDIDLCLRLREQGVRHFYTPFASFRYPQTRVGSWAGSTDDTTRLRSDHAALLNAGDPYYSSLFSTDDVIPRLRLNSRA